MGKTDSALWRGARHRRQRLHAVRADRRTPDRGLLNPTAVGLYSAPLRLLPLVQLPAMALSAGVSPRMAQGRGQASTATFVAALRYIGILQAALIAPLLVWATPIAHILFGPGYAGSADVLRAMTPFAFLLGFGTILSMTANYLGRARLRIAVAVITVAINFVVDIVLIPRIGIVGGAIGTDLGYTLYAPAHLWICKQSLDFSVNADSSDSRTRSGGIMRDGPCTSRLRDRAFRPRTGRRVTRRCRGLYRNPRRSRGTLDLRDQNGGEHGCKSDSETCRWMIPVGTKAVR